MKFGNSMPSGSPLYPEPPYSYKSNSVINILFKTTRNALLEFVPPPLIPIPDNLAFIYIGEFNLASPLKYNYREAGLGIPVIYNGNIGNFFAILYLDPAVSIVPGREIWGWGKKDAEISFTAENGVFKANVVRNEVVLISASVKTSELVTPIPNQPEMPAFNLKIIPSVKKNSPPDVMQLTTAATIAEKQEYYRGEAAISLASSPTDDLGRIPILEVISGEQYIEDLCLDYGDVLFDYLTEPD